MNRKIEPRVGQVDASLLDSELLMLLKNQLWGAFQYYRPEIKDKYESELLLLLKAALFKITVWDHGATYGAKLQNLHFVDTRSRIRTSPISKTQKLLYGAIVVGGSYGWNKLEDYLARATYSDSSSPPSRTTNALRKTADFLAGLWEVSSLANFVLFLYSGEYSTLVLRLLRMRLAPTTRRITRNVNFEFQNRQLVWNAFTEFLLFILPLVNLAKIKRTISRYLQGKKAQKKPTGELGFLPEKTCAICYKQDASSQDVTNPYLTECGHTYCYVCLETALADMDGEWTCLRCGQTVKEIKPYSDVAPIDIKDVEDDYQVDDQANASNEKAQPASQTGQTTQTQTQTQTQTPKAPTQDSNSQSKEDSDSDSSYSEDDDEDDGGQFIFEDF